MRNDTVIEEKFQVLDTQNILEFGRQKLKIERSCQPLFSRDLVATTGLWPKGIPTMKIFVQLQSRGQKSEEEFLSHLISMRLFLYNMKKCLHNLYKRTIA